MAGVLPRIWLWYSMKKWDDLTEQEREEYVNQDQVKPTWRETLACDIGHDVFEALAERMGVADIVSSDTPWMDDTALEEVLTPIEYACIKMFYCERMRRPEIAKCISVQWNIRGEIIHHKKFTHNIVQKKLESARRKIKAAYSQPNGPFSHLLGN